MFLRLAISYSSARVFGRDEPVRLRWATAAACLPSADRVLFGMFEMLRLRLAAEMALRTFLRAACCCLCVAITGQIPRSTDRQRDRGRGSIRPPAPTAQTVTGLARRRRDSETRVIPIARTIAAAANIMRISAPVKARRPEWWLRAR